MQTSRSQLRAERRSAQASSYRPAGPRSHRLLVVLGALLTFPLLLSVNTRALSVALPTSPRDIFRPEDTINLSWSFFAGPVLIAYAIAFRGTSAICRFPISVWVYTFTLLTAFVLGVVTSGGEVAITSAAFLYQSILPISLGWAISRLLDSREKRWAFLVGCLAGVTTASALHAAATLINGREDIIGYNSSLFGLSNPKALRFFPSIVATSLVCWLSVSDRRRFRWTELLALAPGVVIILLGHSRVALTTLVLGSILVAVPRFRRGPHALGLSVLAIGAALVFVGLVGGVGNQQFGGALSRTLDYTEESSESDSRRIDSVLGSAEEAIATPFGLMFRAEAREALSGRNTFVARVTTSENQFAEVGARAGPIAVAAFAALLLKVARATGVLLRARSNMDLLPFIVASLTMGAGMFLQLNATETYSAPIFWTSAFVVMSAARNRDSHHENLNATSSYSGGARSDI